MVQMPDQLSRALNSQRKCVWLEDISSRYMARFDLGEVQVAYGVDASAGS